MPLRLSHVNLPARDPDGLARWYEQRLALKRRGSFLIAPGTLLTFEPGEPLAARDDAHFGFDVDAAEEVDSWAAVFCVPVEREHATRVSRSPIPGATSSRSTGSRTAHIRAHRS